MMNEIEQYTIDQAHATLPHSPFEHIVIQLLILILKRLINSRI